MDELTWQARRRELRQQADAALDRGDVRAAVAILERLRGASLRRRDADALQEVAEVAQSAAPFARGRPKRDLEQLVFAARRNAEFVSGRAASEGAWASRPAPEPTVEARLAVAERRLVALGHELAELRLLTSGVAPAAVTEHVQTPPKSQERPVAATAAASRPAPAAQPATPPAPPGPTIADRALAALRGKSAAWTLAWAGGIVTALGVVLFFALAVNRGWIGPGARVAAGALASALVFGCGAWARRRYGPSYSAFAAVGAGLAGAYATLLAAAALYDLLADWQALIVASGIAGVGLVAALVWRSEFTAGLGLIGAMLVPVAVVAGNGLSLLGTAFVALVLVAAAVVALRLRWDRLATAATLVSAPQIVALVAAGDYGVSSLAVLTALFGLIYAAFGAARQRFAGAGLEALPGSLVVTGAFVSSFAAGQLFSGTDRGIALLVVAAALAAPAGLLLPQKRTRELANLFAVVALAIGAIAVSDLLTGRTLAITWAAEAAVLAWLARRARELRLQVMALGYLALALVHALVIDAPPSDLLNPVAHPATGVPALAAVGLAALAAAQLCGRWGRVRDEGLFAAVAPALGRLRSSQPVVRASLLWISSALWLYAAALGLLAAAQALGPSLDTAYDRGQVAVDLLWAVAALAGVYAGTRRRPALATAGWIVLWITVVKLVGHDVFDLVRPERSLALLVVGAALLLAACALGRLVAVPAEAELLSVLLLTAGAVELARGDLFGADADGLAVLVVALSYGALSAALFRRDRDFSTLLWSTALVLAAAAFPLLVSGSWLVLAWSAAAAVVAALALRLEEKRFLVAAYGYLGLAFAYTMATQAPPRDLFVSGRHPADGVESLVFLIAAAAVTAVICRRTAPAHAIEGPGSLLARLERGQRRWALATAWGAAILLVYGASLGILEVAEAVSSGTVAVDFQRGHVAVSALWGVVGLALLYVGLVRRSAALRYAGFVAFGVTVGKIFLYDLSNLSAVARALSFLGVGAVLLLGGFFYQRLSAELEDRRRTATAP